jgi:hypothetical protein
MENTCMKYHLTMLLIALVSICVLGFESVIKFIVYTLNISTRFSMNEVMFRWTHGQPIQTTLVKS